MNCHLVTDGVGDQVHLAPQRHYRVDAWGKRCLQEQSAMIILQVAPADGQSVRTATGCQLPWLTNVKVLVGGQVQYIHVEPGAVPGSRS